MASTSKNITPGNLGGDTENCVTVDMGCCSDASIASLGVSTAPSGCTYNASNHLGTPYTDGNNVTYDQAYQICFLCDSTAQSGPGSITYPCEADNSKPECSSGAAGDPHIRMFDGKQYTL